MVGSPEVCIYYLLMVGIYLLGNWDTTILLDEVNKSTNPIMMTQVKKRKLYKCGSKLQTLVNVASWTEMHNANIGDKRNSKA